MGSVAAEYASTWVTQATNIVSRVKLIDRLQGDNRAFAAR